MYYEFFSQGHEEGKPFMVDPRVCVCFMHVVAECRSALACCRPATPERRKADWFLSRAVSTSSLHVFPLAARDEMELAFTSFSACAISLFLAPSLSHSKPSDAVKSDCLYGLLGHFSKTWHELRVQAFPRSVPVLSLHVALSCGFVFY